MTPRAVLKDHAATGTARSGSIAKLKDQSLLGVTIAGAGLPPMAPPWPVVPSAPGLSKAPAAASPSGDAAAGVSALGSAVAAGARVEVGSDMDFCVGIGFGVGVGGGVGTGVGIGVGATVGLGVGSGVGSGVGWGVSFGFGACPGAMSTAVVRETLVRAADRAPDLRPLAAATLVARDSVGIEVAAQDATPPRRAVQATFMVSRPGLTTTTSSLDDRRSTPSPDRRDTVAPPFAASAWPPVGGMNMLAMAAARASAAATPVRGRSM